MLLTFFFFTTECWNEGGIFSICFHAAFEFVFVASHVDCPTLIPSKFQFDFLKPHIPLRSNKTVNDIKQSLYGFSKDPLPLLTLSVFVFPTMSKTCMLTRNKSIHLPASTTL